jgi:tRNA 2-thiouridine synthesizing protein A
MTHEAMPLWRHDSLFDGGETGCGDLLFDLRRHFLPLPAGSHVLVIARDSGAPIEMPSWCRMTGHRLVEASHPFYLVERS